MLDLKAVGLIVTCPGTPARLTRFAKNATGCIGIIDPGMSYGPVLTAICNRMVDLAEKSGWKVVRKTLSETVPKRRAREVMEIAKAFADFKVSGVILQPLEFQKDNVAINRQITNVFERQDMSLVLLDYDIVQPPSRSKYDLVSIDNVAAGQLVASRLLSCGARKIAFVLPPNAPSSLTDRMHGVALAVLDAGLPWSNGKNVLRAHTGEASRIRKYIRMFCPDAIVAGNDTAALAIIDMLDALPLRRRPALGSFDGTDKILSTDIVSARQPTDQLAYVAVQTLLSRIKSSGLPPRTIQLSAELA